MSSCSYDDDYPSFTQLGITKPTAKKQYPCRYCHLPIQKGEKHVKHVGISDGDFFSERSHIDCVYVDE